MLGWGGVSRTTHPPGPAPCGPRSRTARPRPRPCQAPGRSPDLPARPPRTRAPHTRQRPRRGCRHRDRARWCPRSRVRGRSSRTRTVRKPKHQTMR